MTMLASPGFCSWYHLLDPSAGKGPVGSRTTFCATTPTPTCAYMRSGSTCCTAIAATAGDGDGMTDPRVVHFWDEQKAVGNWFSQNVTHARG